jgi:5-methylcytosine-specific restriction endonuclease McrA
MRSLKKGIKPNILILNETVWTQELMAYINNGQKVPDHIKGRYRHDEIKDALMKETYHKCAYCESKITHIDYGDIEHIEPKSKVPLKTFTWENLTIGCAKCNQNKKEYYDTSLPLLNPYSDTPEEKIRFLGPYPTFLDDRSHITIRTLKLDRPELIERRSEHLKRIEPLIDLYKKSNDAMRKVLMQDIMELTEVDKEYSLMTKHVLDDLAITG